MHIISLPTSQADAIAELRETEQPDANFFDRLKSSSLPEEEILSILESSEFEKAYGHLFATATIIPDSVPAQYGSYSKESAAFHAMRESSSLSYEEYLLLLKSYLRLLDQLNETTSAILQGRLSELLSKIEHTINWMVKIDWFCLNNVRKNRFFQDRSSSKKNIKIVDLYQSILSKFHLKQLLDHVIKINPYDQKNILDRIFDRYFIITPFDFMRILCFHAGNLDVTLKREVLNLRSAIKRTSFLECIAGTHTIICRYENEIPDYFKNLLFFLSFLKDFSDEELAETLRDIPLVVFFCNFLDDYTGEWRTIDKDFIQIFNELFARLSDKDFKSIISSFYFFGEIRFAHYALQNGGANHNTILFDFYLELIERYAYHERLSEINETTGDSSPISRFVAYYSSETVNISNALFLFLKGLVSIENVYLFFKIANKIFIKFFEFIAGREEEFIPILVYILHDEQYPFHCLLFSSPEVSINEERIRKLIEEFAPGINSIEELLYCPFLKKPPDIFACNIQDLDYFPIMDQKEKIQYVSPHPPKEVYCSAPSPSWNSYAYNG